MRQAGGERRKKDKEGDQNPNLRDEYDLHKKTHRERVMAHHDKGHLVIWTADTNNPGYDKATGQDTERRSFPTASTGSTGCPGDGTVQLDLLTTNVVPMNVDDHNARVASFRIRLG